MSMEDLERAFELIEENFEEDEIEFCEPQKESTIQSAENILACKFPKSYRKFIKEYGCGGAGSLEIYGIIKDEEFKKENIPFVAVPNMVWATLKRNRDFDHPLHLLIIYNVGEGSLYCLDTSQMNEDGECPVVVWPIGGYAQTPVLEVVADDFGAFFLDMVKQQIAYKKESQE